MQRVMIRTKTNFRIWSLLDKALPGGACGTWAFVGCVSSEERSSSAVLRARELVTLSDHLIMRLRDSPASRYFDETESRTTERQQAMIARGIPADCFQAHDLLGSFGEISDTIERVFLRRRTDNLIIDITSMPKKVFFFLIKRAMHAEGSFDNILVTYSEPEGYTDAPLAENPERWNTLPGFDPPLERASNRRVVIAVGYEPLGLPTLVLHGEFSGAETHLVFPFPSPPERIRRNWEFAKQLYPHPHSDLRFDHVDSLNVPDIFDLLFRIGDHGQAQMTLAPYGPKPVALAMALYASRFSSGANCTAVYYTQPTAYNPNYSFGLKSRGGYAAINCYAIRRLGSPAY